MEIELQEVNNALNSLKSAVNDYIGRIHSISDIDNRVNTVINAQSAVNDLITNAVNAINSKFSDLIEQMRYEIIYGNVYDFDKNRIKLGAKYFEKQFLNRDISNNANNTPSEEDYAYLKTCVAACLEDNQEFKIVNITWYRYECESVYVEFIIPESYGTFVIEFPMVNYRDITNMFVKFIYMPHSSLLITKEHALSLRSLKEKVVKSGYKHTDIAYVDEQIKIHTNSNVYEQIKIHTNSNVYDYTDTSMSYDNMMENMRKRHIETYNERYFKYIGPDYERKI